MLPVDQGVKIVENSSNQIRTVVDLGHSNVRMLQFADTVLEDLKAPQALKEISGPITRP